jgi:GT2 family glycosyltransferase
MATLPGVPQPTADGGGELPYESSVVVVAYGTPELDLTWVPTDAEVIVVNNDQRLDRGRLEVSTDHLVWLPYEGNVGFGAGVNRALRHARGRRTILCNPDCYPSRAHYALLAEGKEDEVVVIAQVDRQGRPGSVVSRYPTPLSLLFTVLRLGRLAPRGSLLRRLVTPVLGAWGRAHQGSLTTLRDVDRCPLSEYWVAASLCSVDTERLRSVGGFDEKFFLYREDVDLCRRLAARHPGMIITVPECEPARHDVGGTSSTKRDKRRVLSARWESAAYYCSLQGGAAWWAVGFFCRAGSLVLRLVYRGAPG